MKAHLQAVSGKDVTVLPPLKSGKWRKICGAVEATRQSSSSSSLRHFKFKVATLSRLSLVTLYILDLKKKIVNVTPYLADGARLK